MALLSNLFGGNDDSTSSSDSGNSLDILGDVGSTIGLDFTNSTDSFSRDDDGNVSQDSSDTAFGLDTSTDGLLGILGDTFSSSDESTS